MCIWLHKCFSDKPHIVLQLIFQRERKIKNCNSNVRTTYKNIKKSLHSVLTWEKMVNSIMMEFVYEIRRKSCNVTNRNQMSFYVSLDDIRMSKPLRQHSVNLQHDITGTVKIPQTDQREELNDYCTFGTGLFSNAPRTVNPVLVCSGVTGCVSASCFP